MSWHAQLDLNYTVEDARTVLRFAHTGLLRVLQSLYPEGPGVCHNVLVHPPGGLVGGDTLEVHAQVAAGAHALITTPGATRFYRSEGATALQCSSVHAACRGRRRPAGMAAAGEPVLQRQPGRKPPHPAIGARRRKHGLRCNRLGLPHARQPFVAGRVLQHLSCPACGWSAASSTLQISAC